jgi:hypothetical protein
MASTTVTTTHSRPPARSIRRSVVLATVDALCTCGCGQALDNPRASTCPRCGVVAVGSCGAGSHRRSGTPR